MMKHRVLILLVMVLSICLSACGRETTSTDESDSAVMESTEDPFSLGGLDIDVDASQTEEATEPAVEVEVIETYADGSKTSLYSDGDIVTTSNIDGLPEVDKLTEEECQFLEAVVANWDSDTTISSDYLRDEITTKNMPSLSDTDCQRIRERIEKDKPHAEEETKAYVSETEATSSEQSELTFEEHMKQLENLSDEELDQLIEDSTGGTVVKHGEADFDSVKDIQISGGQ